MTSFFPFSLSVQAASAPVPRLLVRAAIRSTQVLALGLWLSACGAATLAPSDVGGAPKSVIAVQKANGSGVRLSYDTPPATDPKQSVSVSLVFDGVVASDATVRLSADSSLQLESPLTAVSLPSGRSSLTVRARTTVPGLFYLHVQTVQQGRTSVTSVPVQVGNGSAKLEKSGELKPRASGDFLIVMPVP